MSDDTIQPGKFVSLSYTIFDEQGLVAEKPKEPLSFVYSTNTRLLGDMAQAITGKRVGDELELKVSPEKGFGTQDPALIFTSKIDELPEELCQLGAAIQMQDGSGQMRSYIVTSVENGELTIDGNHPLAGINLTVHVKIEEVRDALPGEEQAPGGVHETKTDSDSASFH